MSKMTPYQIGFLSAMKDGPKTIEECKTSSRNIMPTLIRLGMVRSLDFTEMSRQNMERLEVRFELTEAGRLALQEQS